MQTARRSMTVGLLSMLACAALLAGNSSILGKAEQDAHWLALARNGYGAVLCRLR
jgi:hypothetical protein